MRIIHLIRSLDPDTGGPPRVALGLAAAQSHIGLHVSLLTCRDKPQITPAIDRLIADTPGAGHVRIVHLDPPFRHSLPAHLDADLLHLHGLWDACILHAARLARRKKIPYILCPAGTLRPDALAVKPIRKNIALTLGVRRLINHAAAIHVNALPESQNLRALKLTPPIAVIPIGIDVDSFAAPRPRDFAERQHPELVDCRWMLCMARIHPIKRIDHLLRAFAAVADRHPDWQLIVAGPVEDPDYFATLKALADQPPLEKRVLFTGPIEGEMKNAILAGSSLFALPSITENFSIAIAEVLAAGIPVITTRGTPWSDLHKTNSGWWIDHGVEPLRIALDEAMTMDDEDRRAMGLRGRQLVTEQCDGSAIARQSDALYRWLLAGEAKPQCVIDE